MKIIIPGNPLPKKRPRVFTRNRKIMVSDLQGNEKCLASKIICSQYTEMPLSEKVEVRFLFVFSPYCKGSYSKSDIDNLIKFYLDCANKILYTDDRLVCKISAEKRYGTNPRTEMSVRQIDTGIHVLEKDIEKILNIYGPEEITDIFQILESFVQLYNADEDDDWVEDIVGKDETREVRLIRTAYLLSKLSENHSKLLNKVSKKCPQFWKRVEKQVQSTS